MKITTKLIDKIQEDIKSMFFLYQKEMEEAYAIGDDAFNISIGVKITPDDNKEKIVTSISFIKERCKDSITSYCDENQGELFKKGETL